jgi:Fur family peroxide stress response transcriptional regulator
MFTAEEVVARVRECETAGGNQMKITPQRRLIFKALEGKTTHPTADDIYREVKDIIPDISVATVYKTLNELVKLGILLELKHDGEQSRFDPRTDQHSHLMCIGTRRNEKGRTVACGRLEDVSSSFPQLSVPPEDQRGFKIAYNEVIFYGYCPECQQRMGATQAPTA